MLMVNYGVLQLLTDLAGQELPNVPTLMSCVSLSDHDPVTLRTGQQINGRDVNGFNQRPEPGFFRKRIFKWPLEGVCLTEFAEHERWLHDVSTQLWLKKGHVEPTEVRCLSGTVGALTGAQAEAPLFSQGLPGASLCRRAPAVSCEASTEAHFWKKTVTALKSSTFVYYKKPVRFTLLEHLLCFSETGWMEFSWLPAGFPEVSAGNTDGTA